MNRNKHQLIFTWIQPTQDTMSKSSTSLLSMRANGMSSIGTSMRHWPGYILSISSYFMAHEIILNMCFWPKKKWSVLKNKLSRNYFHFSFLLSMSLPDFWLDLHTPYFLINIQIHSPQDSWVSTGRRRREQKAGVKRRQRIAQYALQPLAAQFFLSTAWIIKHCKCYPSQCFNFSHLFINRNQRDKTKPF